VRDALVAPHVVGVLSIVQLTVCGPPPGVNVKFADVLAVGFAGVLLASIATVGAGGLTVHVYESDAVLVTLVAVTVNVWLVPLTSVARLLSDALVRVVHGIVFVSSVQLIVRGPPPAVHVKAADGLSVGFAGLLAGVIVTAGATGLTVHV
jgi:hypothetical protein